MSGTAAYIPAQNDHTVSGANRLGRVVTAELVEVVRYKTTYNAVLPDVPGCVAPGAHAEGGARAARGTNDKQFTRPPG